MKKWAAAVFSFSFLFSRNVLTTTMALVTLAPNRRLLDAAKHGDIEGCLAASGAGADLNSGDPSYVRTHPNPFHSSNYTV